MRIYVDGDACPVKAEVLKVAERYQVPVTIVSNGGLRPSRDPMIQHVIVPHGADAADDWIAEHIGAGEIAITADIPLASRCLEKQARALGPTGKEFDAHNIGMALSMRELNQHLRETGESKGYNKPFDAKDRSSFLQALDRLLAKAV
ncbi:UPF0178 protein [Maritalea myrionectae]|uniref:UPF0178 protein MXMO3_01163 n=1 Tax=Maritalea myrionectae TaxID=454601 RepID=A0A2R4MCM8_9HYPH|nr:YaiI/YqxD family protein [Maritalea myrionectae]AVX03694.1 UPF0178 protein [Maritalea myrionectae]